MGGRTEAVIVRPRLDRDLRSHHPTAGRIESGPGRRRPPDGLELLHPSRPKAGIAGHGGRSLRRRGHRRRRHLRRVGGPVRPGQSDSAGQPGRPSRNHLPPSGRSNSRCSPEDRLDRRVSIDESGDRPPRSNRKLFSSRLFPSRRFRPDRSIAGSLPPKRPLAPELPCSRSACERSIMPGAGGITPIYAGRRYVPCHIEQWLKNLNPTGHGDGRSTPRRRAPAWQPESEGATPTTASPLLR